MLVIGLGENRAWRKFSDFEEKELRPFTRANEFERREAFRLPRFEALRRAVGIVDVSDIFGGRDGATLYFDPRHPDTNGTRIVAEKIYSYLEPALRSKK